jgi:hypothetical protein
MEHIASTDWTMDSNLPDRDAFVAFWSRKSSPLSYLLTLAIYFAILLSFHAIPRSASSPARSIAVAFSAIVFAIGAPVLYCMIFWRRNDRFLRCPACRMWVGSDLMGNLNKCDPDWQRIASTQRCVRCGERMIGGETGFETVEHDTKIDDTAH